MKSETAIGYITEARPRLPASPPAVPAISLTLGRIEAAA